jgi:hypothetical protein
MAAMNFASTVGATEVVTPEMQGSTRKLWWFAPPVAALFYPLFVRALYESSKRLHRATGPGDLLTWLAVVVSIILIYSVPGLGIVVADWLGRTDRTSSSEVFARRLAHLSVASPSLFVLIGVVLYLVRAPDGEVVCWPILWLTAIASMMWIVRRPDHEGLDRAPTNSIPLRIAHGSSALLIVLIFLAWHLLNHASALVSREFNQAMMDALRKWYRSDFVEPLLVVLMLFQVASGVILLRWATAARHDFYRTLQTCTGAFLTAYIASHLNAVFVLGRTVAKVDTTFLWASGTPSGLLFDAWNVRLIPHYSLGVLFVVMHMGLGLRGALLAHQVSPVAADRTAWAVGGLGTALAVAITVAQLKV